MAVSQRLLFPLPFYHLIVTISLHKRPPPITSPCNLPRSRTSPTRLPRYQRRRSLRMRLCRLPTAGKLLLRKRHRRQSRLLQHLLPRLLPRARDLLHHGSLPDLLHRAKPQHRHCDRHRDRDGHGRGAIQHGHAGRRRHDGHIQLGRVLVHWSHGGAVERRRERQRSDGGLGGHDAAADYFGERERDGYFDGARDAAQRGGGKDEGCDGARARSGDSCCCCGVVGDWAGVGAGGGGCVIIMIS